MKKLLSACGRRPLLLIGPLPPPSGGATISFQLFYDFVKHYTQIPILQCSLPVQAKERSRTLGRTNRYRTLMRLLRSLLLIPRCSSVVAFGSKGFCFTFALLIIIGSKCCNKNCYIRFFGGRPAQFVSPLPMLLRSLLFRMLGLADGLVIETQLGASEFPHFLQERISVVPGYRPSMVTSPPVRMPDKDLVRFVFSGQMGPEKGVDLLTEAFSAVRRHLSGVRRIELHLYGVGSENFCKQFQGMQDVYYHGSVDNVRLRKSLQDYDVFVFPSVYANEGHPGSIIEAMLAGLPIIASELSVIKEALSNNVNSILVHPGDADDLAAAMEELALDPKLRHRLGNGSYKSSVHFDAAHVLPKLAKELGILDDQGDPLKLKT